MRTAENILRHELIGLECRVDSASNAYNKGISGKIVDEKMKFIIIDSKGPRKQIAKKDSKFVLKLNNKTVEIDGNFIIARPEDRIKKKIKKW